MADRLKLAGLLETRELGRELYCLDTVDSTNEFLKAQADLCRHGCTVIADLQTEGCGRLGRSWQAPSGSSLLMSVLLRPVGGISAPAVTLACGLAAARALNLLCGGGFGIKWPNDIVSGGKKVCGILCEAKYASTRPCVICGIGLNLTQDAGFFEENGLPHGASVKSLTGSAPSCEQAAAAVLGELEKIYLAYSAGGAGTFLGEYMSLCVTLGRQVIAACGGETVAGTAQAIGPDGSLVVKTADSVVTFRSGEVSVRGEKGYL
jgi:BirA family biotin operon repressor/biotin-[acetyl-CoA-carboxylase] ligase